MDDGNGNSGDPTTEGCPIYRGSVLVLTFLPRPGDKLTSALNSEGYPCAWHCVRTVDPDDPDPPRYYR